MDTKQGSEEFKEANDVKASFDDVYTAETPHAYFRAMAHAGYEIGEQARPYCAAAVRHLEAVNGPAWPVQMLDVGCSYGLGSAFVKYNCTFDELVAFFSTRAPRAFTKACETTRAWLQVAPPKFNMRCVGLDQSEPAIAFAVKAGLLDGGLARDYEQPDVVAGQEDVAWFRGSNLMISTGAIGYVTERTLGVILKHLGKEHPGEAGPVVVTTLLRMFDDRPIVDCFQRHGYAFRRLPDIRLPQRNFVDAAERDGVLETLSQLGVDTFGWEQNGKLYADLCVASREEDLESLVQCMQETRDAQERKEPTPSYIRR